MANDEIIQGKRVACLLGPGFEDSEFKVPYDALKGAGFQVDIIGTKKGEKLEGDKGKETAKVELAIDDAKVGDYIALLVPGGHSPDKLRADERFVRFVRDFEATKRPLAMVCHGPQLLLTAGLAKGRTLTAWQTVQGDLKYAGANVVDREVVVDDNLITSRKPDDLKAFSAKLLEEIRELQERGGRAQSQLATEREEEEEIDRPSAQPIGHEQRETFHHGHPNEADIEKRTAGENLPTGEGPLGAGQREPEVESNGNEPENLPPSKGLY